MTSPTDQLLRYRPWRGEFRSPWFAPWAMARTSVKLLMRRKLFWALYALAAMIFFFFFYGQYLVVWIKIQTENQTVQMLGVPVRISDLLKILDRFNLNGSAHTFANFIWFEGYIAMIVLALAGAVLVGNDFHHRSLGFYLAKPMSRRQYIIGKCLGAGVFVNLLTTLPALALFVQAGLLYDWRSYYFENLRQLAGILGYGLVLTASLSLLLVATAVLVRRTVPLVMAWAGIFVLCRMLNSFLVDGQKFHPSWRLIDLWNNLYLVGMALLDAQPDVARPPTYQPPTWQAALVLVGVGVACWIYLRNRIQAVEIVS